MRLFIVAAFVAAFMALGTSAAFAGEITGSGRSLKQDDGTLHGKLECAWSGLNNFNEPTMGCTQSWGQIPKAGRDFLTSVGSNPGIAAIPRKARAAEPDLMGLAWALRRGQPPVGQSPCTTTRRAEAVLRVLVVSDGKEGRAEPASPLCGPPNPPRRPLHCPSGIRMTTR